MMTTITIEPIKTTLRPTRIWLSAYDKLQGGFLGRIGFAYEIHKAGTGYNKRFIDMIRKFAELTRSHISMSNFVNPRILVDMDYGSDTDTIIQFPLGKDDRHKNILAEHLARRVTSKQNKP